MKVAMILRATAFEAPGGDTIQAKSTAKYLRRLGVDAEVKLTSEQLDYDSFDLLHFFNIIRPADILYHVRNTNLPYVISPIFVNYHEYERKNRQDALGLLSRIFPLDVMEYLKVVARNVKNRERIRSIEYLWKGHKRSIQYLINNCNLLLPNSKSEIQRLFDHYDVSAHYKVVYNGIDTDIFKKSEWNDSNRSGVLCVAQIHGLKNQLNLIRALNQTQIPLTFIGQPTLNAQAYFKKCKEKAGDHVRFIPHLPQKELLEYYQKAKVHVLPSWFETTGLVSLEAAAMGCNIVITEKGDAKEYFKDKVQYCKPDDERDILEKIKTALHSKPSEELRDLIFEKYTWEIAANNSLKAYKEVLR